MHLKLNEEEGDVAPVEVDLDLGGAAVDVPGVGSVRHLELRWRRDGISVVGPAGSAPVHRVTGHVVPAVVRPGLTVVSGRCRRLSRLLEALLPPRRSFLLVVVLKTKIRLLGRVPPVQGGAQSLGPSVGRRGDVAVIPGARPEVVRHVGVGRAGVAVHTVTGRSRDRRRAHALPRRKKEKGNYGKVG